MEEKIENTEKKTMSKKFILPLMVVFAIGLVVASATVYYVSTLNLTVGVNEAFVVSYAVMGEGGTYITGNCADVGSDYWFTSESQNIPTGGFYPLESRKVCVRIQNKGEVAIPYIIKSTVTNDNANNDCANAFGLSLIHI